MADIGLKNALDITNRDEESFVAPDGAAVLLEYINTMSSIGQDILTKALSDKDSSDLLGLLYSTAGSYMESNQSLEWKVLAQSLKVSPMASAYLISFLMKIIIGIVTTEEIR